MSRFTFTGRLVQGNPHKAGAQRKDTKTGAVKFRKDGTPDAPFYMAVAIEKIPARRFVIQGNPGWESQKALIDNDARLAWPQFFGQRPPGLQFDATLPLDCTNPKFANKIIDGDGFDDNGQPNANNDGWAGCWVVKVSNGYAPKVYEWTASGWQETIHTGRTIKCGDYVTVSGDCTSNTSNDSPGMYMNVDTVSFEQEGVAIISASNVNPNEALGQRGAPNGQPPASAHAGTAGAPVHGAQSSATAQPYSGYRETGAPPPPGATPPPPPAGPQMTDKATTTYEAYIAAGWTDAQLRSNGLMV